MVACATFVLWEKITVGGGRHLRTLLPVDFGFLLTPSGTYSPVWNWLEFCLTLFTLPTWQWPALPYELYIVDLLRSWDASLSIESFTTQLSLISRRKNKCLSHETGIFIRPCLYGINCRHQFKKYYILM